MGGVRTRTVLVTGGGGSGRTTVAAATALAAARSGHRALLLSAEDPALLEALFGTGGTGGTDGEGASREVAPGLVLSRLDSGADFRARAVALQERARSALDLLGAEPLDDDELAEPPGADAFALLRALRAAHDPAGGGPYDVVVADMPPVGRAVRTLALPEHTRRWLRRLLPPERQAARALRPVLAQLAGAPMPARSLYEAAGRLDRELAAVQAVVESPGTTVRLVVEPGPAAVRALRAARAALALHGLALDAVVANRLLPTASPDPWLAGLASRQRKALKELLGDCPDGSADVCELPHLGREPQGAADLGELAERIPPPGPPPGAAPGGDLAGDRAEDRAEGPWTVEDRLADEGVLLWRLPLPGAVRETLSLVRRGDEVVVTTGPFRRVLPLPAALRRCAVAGARLADGELTVRFEPESGLWPARD
ncbi:ArsA family ATPase [Streptomyces verrucosisporus]|uniref:ArsA family ATPase n=1 Tax=Streptomyces verrucosisporus TaxID=1695161 RepID=UPI0019D22D8A|nr:ArsA-related P-loop ATPase [Streptomyces verrucosisporus]MBN3928326.1 ArsA family ATPase [Streptomyces verrucosisporus]